MINPLARLEGKYEILEKIQEGGMGAIYKVRHLLLDELRVIKVMRPHLRQDHGLRERFLAEGRTAARLSHPNIARIFDCTLDEEGVAYLVMEFIPGWTLGDLLRRGSLLPLDLCLEISQQCLAAIGHMHLHKMVHRDIAPDNLILGTTVDGRPLVKLIDLGIAKATEGGSQLTDAGVFIGKFRYAAPELFDEASPRAEPRSDLYSLALVLYELATLKFPITGSTSSSLIAGHLFRPPLDFAETDPEGRLPEPFRQALLRALAKTPEERFANAADFAAALPSHTVDTESRDLRQVLALTAQPRPEATTALYRSGSTQAQFDAQFAPIATPAPYTLEFTARQPTTVPGSGPSEIPSIEQQLGADNPLSKLATTDPNASTVILLPDSNTSTVETPAAPPAKTAGPNSSADLALRTATLLEEAKERAAREDFTAARQILDHLLNLDANHQEAQGLRRSLESLVEVQIEETRRTEILAHLQPGSRPVEVRPGPPEATKTVVTPKTSAGSVDTLETRLESIRQMQQGGQIGSALQALQQCVQKYGEDARLNDLRSELGMALLAQDAEQQEAIDPFGTVPSMNAAPAPSAGPMAAHAAPPPPPPGAAPSGASTTPSTPPTVPGGDGLPLHGAAASPAESPPDSASHGSPSIDAMLPSAPIGAAADGEGPLSQMTLNGHTALTDLQSLDGMAGIEGQATEVDSERTLSGVSSPRSAALPTRQNPRSLLIGGVVLVLLFAVLGVLLSRYRPASSPTAAGLAAEDVVATQLSPGFLALDARPWGDIEVLEDQNQESPTLESRQTPTVLSLPPGTYRLVLRYPPEGDRRELEIEIRSGEMHHHLEVFRTIDSETYLRVQSP